MNTYSVTFVVDDMDFGDAAMNKLFTALPDASPTEIDGFGSVGNLVAAASPEEAVFALVADLEDLDPGAVVVRLDQDLVSISDIAARVDRSRESIRLLVDGKRGPGNFPRWVGIVGDAIRVWPWATVAEWLQRELGLALDEYLLIDPDTAAVVDARLVERRRQRLSLTG